MVLLEDFLNSGVSPQLGGTIIYRDILVWRRITFLWSDSNLEGDMPYDSIAYGIPYDSIAYGINKPCKLCHLLRIGFINEDP